jgi:hypothetical protein
MRTLLLTICLVLSTAPTQAATLTATVQRSATVVTDTGPISALANITTPTNQTTSYIALTEFFTPQLGNLDINHGWSSNNPGTMTPTTVQHSLLWSYTFDQLVDGGLSADITIARTGSNSGINGITLSDNYGNTQTFTNSGTWSIPLLGGNTYVFSAVISNSRTGNNGLNVNTAVTTTVDWIIVPEPNGFLFAAFVVLLLLLPTGQLTRRC